MRKFRVKILITSHKIDGVRYTFKPGDIMEEKYILPQRIEPYLKTGVFEEVSEDVEAPAVKPAKVKPSGLHKKKKVTGEEDSE
jgi:hypothetical protein